MSKMYPIGMKGMMTSEKFLQKIVKDCLPGKFSHPPKSNAHALEAGQQPVAARLQTPSKKLAMKNEPKKKSKNVFKATQYSTYNNFNPYVPKAKLINGQTKRTSNFKANQFNTGLKTIKTALGVIRNVPDRKASNVALLTPAKVISSKKLRRASYESLKNSPQFKPPENHSTIASVHRSQSLFNQSPPIMTRRIRTLSDDSSPEPGNERRPSVSPGINGSSKPKPQRNGKQMFTLSSESSDESDGEPAPIAATAGTKEPKKEEIFPILSSDESESESPETKPPINPETIKIEKPRLRKLLTSSESSESSESSDEEENSATKSKASQAPKPSGKLTGARNYKFKQLLLTSSDSSSESSSSEDSDSGKSSKKMVEPIKSNSKKDTESSSDSSEESDSDEPLRKKASPPNEGKTKPSLLSSKNAEAGKPLRKGLLASSSESSSSESSDNSDSDDAIGKPKQGIKKVVETPLRKQLLSSSSESSSSESSRDSDSEDTPPKPNPQKRKVGRPPKNQSPNTNGTKKPRYKQLSSFPSESSSFESSKDSDSEDTPPKPNPQKRRVGRPSKNQSPNTNGAKKPRYKQLLSSSSSESSSDSSEESDSDEPLRKKAAPPKKMKNGETGNSRRKQLLSTSSESSSSEFSDDSESDDIQQKPIPQKRRVGRPSKISQAKAHSAKLETLKKTDDSKKKSGDPAKKNSNSPESLDTANKQKDRQSPKLEVSKKIDGSPKPLVSSSSSDISKNVDIRETPLIDGTSLKLKVKNSKEEFPIKTETEPETNEKRLPSLSVSQEAEKKLQGSAKPLEVQTPGLDKTPHTKLNCSLFESSSSSSESEGEQNRRKLKRKQKFKNDEKLILKPPPSPSESEKPSESRKRVFYDSSDSDCSPERTKLAKNSESSRAESSDSNDHNSGIRHFGENPEIAIPAQPSISLTEKLDNVIFCMAAFYFSNHEALNSMFEMEILDLFQTEPGVKRGNDMDWLRLPKLTGEVQTWSLDRFIAHILELSRCFITPKDYATIFKDPQLANSLKKLLDEVQQKSIQCTPIERYIARLTDESPIRNTCQI